MENVDEEISLPLLGLKDVLTGLFSGLIVVLYRYIIGRGTDLSLKAYELMRQKPLLVLPWLGFIVLAGFIIAYLVRKEPMASGSGIPQVEGIFSHGLKILAMPVILVRFLAGTVASFFGLSLGREGPSIQMGACGGELVGQKFSSSKKEKDLLITGGAAAGLAAAFNAPLSGMVFALEEVHKAYSKNVLVVGATAALTADLVSKIFFGTIPELSFVAMPDFTGIHYLWLLPLGVVSGLVGSLINKGLLDFQTLYGKIPAKFRPVVALAIALPCGIFLPEVLGGGRNLVSLSEMNQVALSTAVIYLIVKLLFTCTSFGSGAPGGIFMPILAVGALTGNVLGQIAVGFGMGSIYIPYFVVCAMAGTLAASVKAPLTSILLIAEMTGSLTHMLPIATSAMLALFISDNLKIVPIYDALLERMPGIKAEVKVPNEDPKKI